jgi:membrane associated rhomboid family serine protease
VNINIPPVTQALMLISGIVFLAMSLVGADVYTYPFYWFGLWPLGMEGQPVSFMPWQLITYGFLHGSMSHVLFNMFGVFMFGSEIERLFGSRWYASYFLVCIVTAGIAQLIVAAVSGGPPYPTVGASGGLFGLLLAFAMYFPRREIMLIFLPIPIQAWAFVLIYGAVELFLGVTGTAPGVAHFAHLGGMVGGFLMIVNRRGRWRR